MATPLDASPPSAHLCYGTAGPCNELDWRSDPNEKRSTEKGKGPAADCHMNG